MFMLGFIDNSEILARDFQRSQPTSITNIKMTVSISIDELGGIKSTSERFSTLIPLRCVRVSKNEMPVT